MIINNDSSDITRKTVSRKTAYYRRFIKSGQVNAGRFMTPGKRSKSEADSGESAKEALAAAGRLTKKTLGRLEGLHGRLRRTGKTGKYRHTYSPVKKGQPKDSSIKPGRRFRTGAHGKGNSAGQNGPDPAKAFPDSHELQKQHIKKEYQKKAIAAAAAVAAPETAAAGTAVNAASGVTSRGIDGTGKMMMAAITAMCIIPLIMVSSTVYAASFFIEPLASYLNTAMESYPGVNGDGDSEIITDASDSPVAAEALNDPGFAALITEAEKYLGYPYVWGGSSPSTGFDCSGFVCWVYRESGYHDMPRMTAQNIFNVCTPISYEEARPGDLVFFTGTYISSHPVTHIGIYVGSGYMIHAGDPIQYTSIDTDYWTGHFYAYGRLN